MTLRKFFKTYENKAYFHLGYIARNQHEAAYYLLNSGSFKMSADLQQTAWHCIPED
jgi:hypothetical protein